MSHSKSNTDYFVIVLGVNPGRISYEYDAPSIVAPDVQHNNCCPGLTYDPDSNTCFINDTDALYQQTCYGGILINTKLDVLYALQRSKHFSICQTPRLKNFESCKITGMKPLNVNFYGSVLSNCTTYV